MEIFVIDHIEEKPTKKPRSNNGSFQQSAFTEAIRQKMNFAASCTLRFG
jgi:hypothetical protein